MELCQTKAVFSSTLNLGYKIKCMKYYKITLLDSKN